MNNSSSFLLYNDVLGTWDTINYTLSELESMPEVTDESYVCTLDGSKVMTVAEARTYTPQKNKLIKPIQSAPSEDFISKNPPSVRKIQDAFKIQPKQKPNPEPEIKLNPSPPNSNGTPDGDLLIYTAGIYNKLKEMDNTMDEFKRSHEMSYYTNRTILACIYIHLVSCGIAASVMSVPMGGIIALVIGLCVTALYIAGIYIYAHRH